MLRTIFILFSAVLSFSCVKDDDVEQVANHPGRTVLVTWIILKLRKHS